LGKTGIFTTASFQIIFMKKFLLDFIFILEVNELHYSQ